MLPGGGSFRSVNVRILTRRRNSRTARRVFLEHNVLRGIRNNRSIVDALIARIFVTDSIIEPQMPVTVEHSDQYRQRCSQSLAAHSSRGLPEAISAVRAASS